MVGATLSAEEIACLNEQIEFGRKLSRQLLADDPEALRRLDGGQR
jgi:hypothetical protein